MLKTTTKIQGIIKKSRKGKQEYFKPFIYLPTKLLEYGWGKNSKVEIIQVSSEELKIILKERCWREILPYIKERRVKIRRRKLTSKWKYSGKRGETIYTEPYSPVFKLVLAGHSYVEESRSKKAKICSGCGKKKVPHILMSKKVGNKNYVLYFCSECRLKHPENIDEAIRKLDEQIKS